MSYIYYKRLLINYKHIKDTGSFHVRAISVPCTKRSRDHIRTGIVLRTTNLYVNDYTIWFTPSYFFTPVQPLLGNSFVKRCLILSPKNSFWLPQSTRRRSEMVDTSWYWITLEKHSDTESKEWTLCLYYYHGWV